MRQIGGVTDLDRPEIQTQIAALPLFRNVDLSFLFSPAEKDSGLFLTLRDKESLPQNKTPALGILLSGRAVICSADTGRTVILRTLLAGDIFGAAGLFANAEQPLSRTVSDGESAFYLIRKSAVEKLMDQSRPFREKFLAFLSDRVSFLNRKIRCFTAGNAGRRLALFLLCEEHDVISLPLSYAAFADMLDISRASLYRALDELSVQKLIKKSGHEITLLDRAALLAFCEHPTQTKFTA